MFDFFYQISTRRTAWALLALCTFIFELCALFFQYVLNLDPCVMCIYERVAMLGVLVGGIVGCIAPSNVWIRWLAIAAFVGSSAKGLHLAYQHVSYQFPDPNLLFGPTCDIFVSFPSWAPLNQWVPWFFEASGDCSKVVWQFLTLSMPQWLVVIFAAMLIISLLVGIAQFVGSFTKQSR